MATGRLAVFLPAWDESAVIGAMLTYALKTFGDADYRIYVGCYPNDPRTIAAVQAIGSPKIRLAVSSQEGPTTKADCLNTMWRTLIADEITEGRQFKGIVLHDAEDVVHSGELAVFDTLIERFAFVQLPVLPLPDSGSRWIAGHYADEFAEAHGKTLVVREAIGAAIPAAGVGCAFARQVLGRIAEERGGEPFDRNSLTEDYEIGLRIAELGGKGIFVRLPGSKNAGVVGIRAHFPRTLQTAVRQKSRWIAGIALSGWDRLGWSGGFAETWMRLHDRRAPMGAIILTSAYVGSLIQLALWLAGEAIGLPPSPTPHVLSLLLPVCGALLFWRLLMRALFVGRIYGLSEGLLSMPRAVVGNVIAIMAARRALWIYLTGRRDGVVRWDKTAHAFPVSVSAE